MKIIFSDIDGTIINSKHVITKKTKEYLKTLNIPVILVSARMPQGIEVVQKQFDNHDPIICYSGALVLKENEILYDRGIDIEKALKVYNDLNKEKISVSTYCYDKWYCTKIDEWIKQEEEITGLKVIEGSFEKEKKVHKFLCMAKKEDINKLKEEIEKKYPELSVYKSKETYLEIMDGNVSKLKALNVLLQYYDIDIKDSISFGDNYNDLDMLLNTGMSFVMDNAPEDMKKKIKRVTKSNDEDGVIYSLKNLL